MRINHKTAVCHPERRHAAKGLCFECYNERYPKAKRADCHPERIAFVGGLCRVCYDRKLKQENPEYAARQRVNHAKWVSANFEANNERKREYQKLTRVQVKDRINARYRQLARFGLTWEDEQRILEEQEGGCGICGGETSGKAFDLDHDHLTGRFRGLLCHRCNKGLGLLGDTEEALEKAATYLRRTKQA